MPTPDTNSNNTSDNNPVFNDPLLKQHIRNLRRHVREVGIKQFLRLALARAVESVENRKR